MAAIQEQVGSLPARIVLLGETMCVVWVLGLDEY